MFARDRAADQSSAERWAFYLLAVSVLACVPIGVARGRVESAVITERLEPYRLAAGAGAGPRPWSSWRRARDGRARWARGT